MLISGWLLPQRASSSTYLSERTLSSNKPTLSVFIPDLGFRLRTEEVPLIARIDAAGVSLRVKNTTEDCQFLYFLGDQPVGRLVPVIVGRKLESGTVQPVPVDERRLQVDYLIAACARLRLEVLPHSEDRAVFGFAQFLRRIHGRANWVQDEDHGIAAQTGLHGNLIKKVVDRPLRIGDALLQRRGRTGRTGVRIPGSTAALEQRIADSQRAVDYFLDQVPVKSGLGSDAVIFVLDPIRPAMYSPEELRKAENGSIFRMRQYFKTQASARGYQVVDLQPAFIHRHRLDGSRFEFPTDNHWNELANRLVAEEIQKSAVFSRIFRAETHASSVHARN